MDNEREKFRTYIEKSGVMSVLTDVLVGLYENPDRPSDPLQYVLSALKVVNSDADKVQILEDKVNYFNPALLMILIFYI